MTRSWQVTVTLQRGRETTNDEVRNLLASFAEWASSQGWLATTSSLKPAERTNCPHCGHIVRSPTARRCPTCGLVFETGKTK